MKSFDLFKKYDVSLREGETCAYYVYPKGRLKFERTLVYLHGLLSDIHWFEIPENLPKDTAILFLPRYPRTHANSFEDWTRHYEECFRDFKKSHEGGFYHLLGHCFGAFSALHWATIKPDNFSSLTLVSPPFHLKKSFHWTSKLALALAPKNKKRRCFLTARAFSRLSEIKNFIEQNPTTTFDFTNGFYLEASHLGRWLRNNIIAYPVPTHYLYSSEDEVLDMGKYQSNGQIRDLADETSLIYSDHYAELLPEKNEFWRSVFHFQLEHEPNSSDVGRIRKVLVSGATGFLGSHIVRALIQDGKEPVCLVRDMEMAGEKFAGAASSGKNKIEFRKGSLDDEESLGKALEGIDAVIHTAAHVSDWDRPEKFYKINVEGTKNLLMLAHARGVKHFIHISSLGVLGDTDQDNIDENSPMVWSGDPYSNSKIMAEFFVRKFSGANHIPFTILRPGFIYGEGDNHFLPRLCASLKNRQFKYVGSKNNILNAVYVGNVSALVLRIIGNPECFGQTYHITDPGHVSIGEFIPKISKALGLSAPEKVIPKHIAFGAAALVESLYKILRLKQAPSVTRKKMTFVGRSRSVNSQKACRLLGGRMPFSFEEGMQRTLEAFKHVP
ncbi:MAG: NAD-dependent epimerase/dehydratase family protein [Candidatus Omnitrophica bacterium]|nr:NAD-dependent epimerase/dehydratase family protein [Candidatus Omnitrophota bacterium]